MKKNKTIKKDVKKVKKKKDLDSKVIKKLNKRISCLETENKKIKELLHLLEEGNITTVKLWSFGHNGKDEHTDVLATIASKNEQAFCEWWQLYNNFIPDGIKSKFIFDRQYEAITWDVEQGKKLLNEKLLKTNYRNMEEWLNNGK